MAWIAGWFLLISLALGFIFQYYWRNIWISTVLVLGGGFFAMYEFFYLSFWPFLLAYVLLCWFGAWLANYVRQQRHS